MIPPVIGQLNHVNASYETPYGVVKSSWTNNKGHFTWHITVPPNSKALVYIPAGTGKTVTESGRAAHLP
jgi:alpha-L-rhamnosidase